MDHADSAAFAVVAALSLAALWLRQAWTSPSAEPPTAAVPTSTSTSTALTTLPSSAIDSSASSVSALSDGDVDSDDREDNDISSSSSSKSHNSSKRLGRRSMSMDTPPVGSKSALSKRRASSRQDAGQVPIRLVYLFVNPGSGAKCGASLLDTSLTEFVFQEPSPIRARLFPLTPEGLARGMKNLKTSENMQRSGFARPFVMVAGGDGSVTWILQQLAKEGLAQDIPVGVLPLGTGNDLARVLGWYKATNYELTDNGLESTRKWMHQVTEGTPKLADMWTVSFSVDSDTGSIWQVKSSKEAKLAETSKESVMINYTSIGRDAETVFATEKRRRATPMGNKIVYGLQGALISLTPQPPVTAAIKALQFGQYNVALRKLGPQQCLLFQNVPSYGGGADVWSTARPHKAGARLAQSQKPSMPRVSESSPQLKALPAPTSHSLPSLPLIGRTASLPASVDHVEQRVADFEYSGAGGAGGGAGAGAGGSDGDGDGYASGFMSSGASTASSVSLASSSYGIGSSGGLGHSGKKPPTHPPTLRHCKSDGTVSDAATIASTSAPSPLTLQRAASELPASKYGRKQQQQQQQQQQQRRGDGKQGAGHYGHLKGAMAPTAVGTKFQSQDFCDGVVEAIAVSSLMGLGAQVGTRSSFPGVSRIAQARSVVIRFHKDCGVVFLQIDGEAYKLVNPKKIVVKHYATVTLLANNTDGARRSASANQ